MSDGERGAQGEQGLQGPEGPRGPHDALPVLLIAIILALAATMVAGGVILKNLDATSQNNRESICGSANATALAFREPQPGESQGHFAKRLLGQRYTLQSASDLNCEDITELHGFDKRVRQALHEIDKKLGEVRVVIRRANPPKGKSTPKPSNPSQGAPTASQSTSGGGSESAAPSAPSQPAPSPSGGGNGGSNNGGGNSPPPPTPPPASNPPAVDVHLGDNCFVNALGVRVCL